jgi:Predicted esterase of the alpha/beta hydrolase fold
MTRTLILPGLHDSDPRHWQSRWEARDDTLLRVIQDDWETPHCADWIAKLDQALALTGPDTVLVLTAPVARWSRIGLWASSQHMFVERFWLHPATLRL